MVHESTLLAINTVLAFNNDMRTLCEGYMTILERRMIGGPGYIVEIDEVKLSKRKYNRGREVGPILNRNGTIQRPDLWAFGGVERLSLEQRADSDRRGGQCFIILVEKRSSNVLFPIITRFI